MLFLSQVYIAWNSGAHFFDKDDSKLILLPAEMMMLFFVYHILNLNYLAYKLVSLNQCLS